MRRVLGLALALLLVGSFAFGLDLAVGVKGGAGHSMFLGKDYADYMAGWAKRAFFLAYGGGVFATIGLMDMIAIQPEVLYLQIGGADIEEGVGTEYWISTHVVPAVLVKARFDMVNVFAGPAVLFKLGNGKYKVKWEGGGEDESEFADGAVRGMLFAATAGVGVQYPLGMVNLVGEVRAFYVFSNWLGEDAAPVFGVWNPLTAVAMVGVSVPLGGFGGGK